MPTGNKQPTVTKAHQMMIDDGFPQSLFFTSEQREQAWIGKQLKPVSTFEVSRTPTPEAIAIIETLSEQKQMKIQARKTKTIQQKTTPNLKTHHWDTFHSRWVLNRIYRREDNMRPDFYTLDNSELVKVFNEMAIEAASLELPVTAVRRFSTRDAGLRRCEEVYKNICEKKSLDYENPPVRPPPEKEAPQPTKPAKKAKVKKAKVEKPQKDRLPISEACNVRSGSLMETILVFLEGRLGKQVPESAIFKHLYGDPDRKTNRIFHLSVVMKQAKGYILKQEKDEKGNISYGLYKKNGSN